MHHWKRPSEDTFRCCLTPLTLTVGLIARACEEAGMSTCCVALVRSVAEQVKPPRTLFLRWPFGNPCGEPGNALQQRRVVLDLLEAVRGLREPATIIDLPYRWRREDWGALEGLSLP